VLYTASQQDAVSQAQAGNPAAPLEEGSDAALANKISDLMLPLVKGLGSERAWVLLGTESLQTYGGSGFLQDYPVEQYVRDAKIDTLYEGTTTIQGMDLFFRKIVRDQGQALGKLAGEITDFAKATGNGLDKERELLAQAVEDVQAIIGHNVNELMASVEDPKNIYKVGQNTTRALMALGDLVVGWLLLRQAEVAQTALPSASDRDKPFYEGKVAAAKWFAANVFPALSSSLAIAQAVDNSLMELDEAAF
jgi:hypothetical protein